MPIGVDRDESAAIASRVGDAGCGSTGEGKLAAGARSARAIRKRRDVRSAVRHPHV